MLGQKIPLILLLVTLSMINSGVSAQVQEERLLIMTESHRLGQDESQDGRLTISWNTPDDITITRISAGEFSDWFGFKLSTFVLKGDEIKSIGFIPYTVHSPVAYCNEGTGTTLNCAEERVYDIEVLIEGTIGNSNFSTTASIKIDIVNKQSEAFQILTILAVIGSLALIVYKTKQWKKSRSTRKTGYRREQRKNKFTDDLKLHE